MATITRTKLLSPGGATVIARDGAHTKVWRGFFEDVARELSRRIVIVAPSIDPPSIGAGGSVKVVLTITGGRLDRGSFATASFTTLHEDVSIAAAVTDTDKVTVTFRNNSASAIDMASGTLRVRLETP